MTLPCGTVEIQRPQVGFVPKFVWQYMHLFPSSGFTSLRGIVFLPFNETTMINLWILWYYFECWPVNWYYARPFLSKRNAFLPPKFPLESTKTIQLSSR